MTAIALLLVATLCASSCLFVLSLAVTFTMRMGARQTALVLELLASTPAALMGRDLVRRSGGKLGRGTVYVWLSELEDAGLIESASVRGTSHRMYWLTDAGKRAAKESG